MGEDDQEKRGLDAQIAVGIEGNLKRPTATGQPEQLKPKAQVIKEVLA